MIPNLKVRASDSIYMITSVFNTDLNFQWMCSISFGIRGPFLKILVKFTVGIRRMCLFIYVCMYVYTYMCVYVCTYIHVRMYVGMYVCVYMYVWDRMQFPGPPLEDTHCTTLEKPINVIYGEDGASRNCSSWWPWWLEPFCNINKIYSCSF